jgi:hypothetical protein
MDQILRHTVRSECGVRYPGWAHSGERHSERGHGFRNPECHGDVAVGI